MDARRPRVLVVDDDTRIASLLADMLGTLGYTSTVAHRGQDALAKAAANRPDVVLLDLTLADMAGAEVLDALRQVHRDVPIIVMTGDPERARGLLERGAAAYLAKPFRVDALRQTLAQYAGSGQVSGE